MTPTRFAVEPEEVPPIVSDARPALVVGEAEHLLVRHSTPGVAGVLHGEHIVTKLSQSFDDSERVVLVRVERSNQSASFAAIASSISVRLVRA